MTNDNNYNIAILTSTSIFFAVAWNITRMQISVLRPLYDIAMSYLLDIQKMLEMTILYTQTAEGQIVSTPRYKVPSRFYVFLLFEDS